VKSSEQPAIAIRPNRDALARWDMDLGSLQDYAETALSGHNRVGDVGGRESGSTSRCALPVAARQSVDAIKNLRVPLKDGALVPLKALADVAIDAGRAAITRESGKRYVGIRMNVRNRDLGSFVDEARRRVATAVALPPATS